MIVCHCRGISDRVIRQAIRQGASTRRQVSEACGASVFCGGCGPAVDEIIASETGRPATRLVTLTEFALSG